MSTFIAFFLFPFLISKRCTIIIASSWAKITIYLLNKICGIIIKFNDLNRIYQKGIIFAIRHESILDTILFLAYQPNIKYIVKKELLFVPFYGFFVWRSGHIVIDRQGKAKALSSMMNKVKTYINDGLNVIIFPHGTRVRTGENSDVRSGIYGFYKILNLDIVPVNLKTSQVWDRRGFIKRPGIVEVNFFDKIDKGLSKNKFLSILNSKLN